MKKRADSTNRRKPLPSSQEERIAYYKKKYGEDFTSPTKTS
jgi:hypothetical protein